jgi:hypothetical protein
MGVDSTIVVAPTKDASLTVVRSSPPSLADDTHLPLLFDCSCRPGPVLLVSETKQQSHPINPEASVIDLKDHSNMEEKERYT